MRSRVRVSAALGFALCPLLPVGPARAEFRVCNQSVGVYNVAIGAERDGQFATEGWWVMPANTCVVPIKEDLDQLKLRYVYVYTQTVTGLGAVQGNWDMCIDTKRFKIEKITGEPWNCWVRGYEQVKFLEVDTADSKSWTLFVKPGRN